MMKANQPLWMLGALAVVVTAARAAEIPKTWTETEAGSPTGEYLVIDLTPVRIALGKQPDPKTPPRTMQGFVVSNLAAVPPGGWTDEYKTTKLVLRRIPAGTFTMGSPTNEMGRDADETEHPVTLTKDFYIGVFEVTMRQWELVMGKPIEGHYKRPKDADAESVHPATYLPEIHRRPVEQITFYEIRESPTTDVKAASAAVVKPAPASAPKKPAAGKKPEAGSGDVLADDESLFSPTRAKEEQERAERERKAVQNELERRTEQPSDDPQVDWPANNVVNPGSFFGMLRAKTTLAGLDLPTESQWEYACRAGTTTALNSGKAITQEGACPNLAEVGRYLLNVDPSDGWRYNRYDVLGTSGVGLYAPNKWGLYDMHGNVWEWCLDWYAPLSSEAATDPKGPTTGLAHVLRGGSWDDRAKACRSANRGEGGIPSTKNGFFGFRVALRLPQ